MVYEVVMVELPSKKQIEEEGTIERLLLPPTAIVAKSEADAAMRIGLTSEARLAMEGVNPDRVEVYVRPFVWGKVSTK